jgi:hypothetical protein
MFDGYTSTQLIADNLKSLIHRAAPRGRRAAMTVLQQFERCGWHARAFEEACAGRFTEVAGELRYEGSDVVADITDTLTRYLELAGCAPKEFPDPMGADDAARYLGCTLDTLKYHIHRTGNLVPTLEGHKLLFSKAMLDEFKANKRSVGRPKQVKE